MNALSRRNFLHLGATACAAAYTLGMPLPASAAADPAMLYGVQLYTLHKEATADLPGALKTLARLGYTELELYAFAYTQPVQTLRSMIEDAGLHAPAGHIAPAQVMATLDYAHDLGLRYIVCQLPRPKPVSLEDYRLYGAELNRLGAAAKARGIELAFLGHNHEFLPQDGSTGFAEMMRATDPALVKLELDIYWVVQAGLDPAAFLHEHRDRIRLLHLKDRLPNVPTSFETDAASSQYTEVGKGTIAWGPLLAQARRQGIRYAFIDQDVLALPAFDSLRDSMTYLKTLKP